MTHLLIRLTYGLLQSTAVLAGKPVVPVALNGTFSLMSRDAVDTGGSTKVEDRLVTVQIGTPLYPDTELDEEAAVLDLR